MGPVTFGYLRADLVTDRRRDVEQMMREFGELHGLGGVQFFCEPGPTLDVLWSLYAAVATAGPQQHVVMPTPAHLDGLAESRSLLLQRFTDLRAQVWYLSTEANSVTDRRHAVSVLPDMGGASLVGEFTCRALPTSEPVARLHLHEDLTRAGLRDMVDAAEAVVVSLVVDAVRAAQSEISAASPIYAEIDAQFNQLTVRLSRTADELLIEVHETRAHSDEPIRVTVSSRGRASRTRARDGGTVTWCALPLAREWHELGDAVGRYTAMVDAERGGRI
ncbi:hypothetical protein [Nocardia yamanashiensis]|uniref:hypothetical protein n=1 Tax=Nocardia yamanashiensis TaxID=209247 RepID=UPI00082AE4E5|nr:hypothetical protein [Nocardia yamanashiensis]